jgi:hypothetical protein
MIVAMRQSAVAIHWAGRFGDGLSAIVLKRDADVPVAVGALERAHIKISHFVTLRRNSVGCGKEEILK